MSILPGRYCCSRFHNPPYQVPVNNLTRLIPLVALVSVGSAMAYAQERMNQLLEIRTALLLAEFTGVEAP